MALIHAVILSSYYDGDDCNNDVNGFNDDYSVSDATLDYKYFCGRFI